MKHSLHHHHHAPDAQGRHALALCSALIAANIAAWIWAVLAFGGKLELLGICALVYGLGLRHAIDADHITAIDNVTRKMMQEDKRPVSVGFFFALGHSAVVILVTIVVALAAGSTQFFDRLQGTGRTVSTIVSATLLLAIAAMNVEILRSLKRDAGATPGDADPVMGPAGFLSRIFAPILRLVGRSWHMLPLGFLFGLGFDTATEVAMFGVSTAQAAKGLGIGSILLFPILFTAGMSLVDTIDGVAMMQAYRWAFITPERRRRYNMAITLVSATSAGAIGVVQIVDLLGDTLVPASWFRSGCHFIEAHVNMIGAGLLCFFAGAWLLSYAAAKGALRRRRIETTVI